jgi:hypothetical protein
VKLKRKIIGIISITLLTLSFTVSSFATDNYSETLNQKSDYYSLYYRGYQDNQYRIFYKDLYFSENGLLTFFNIKDSNNNLENIEKNIRSMSSDFQELLVKRSGLNIEVANERDVRSITPQVVLDNIQITSHSNIELITCDLSFDMSNIKLPCKLYSVISTKDEIEKKKKVVDPKVKKKKDDPKIIYKNKDVYINSYYQGSGNNNVKPINNTSKVSNSLLTEHREVSSIIRNVSIVSSDVSSYRLPVIRYKLDMKFIVAHSYYGTTSIGIVVMLISLAMIISTYKLLSWYKGKTKRVIYRNKETK